MPAVRERGFPSRCSSPALAPPLRWTTQLHSLFPIHPPLKSSAKAGISPPDHPHSVPPLQRPVKPVRRLEIPCQINKFTLNLLTKMIQKFGPDHLRTNIVRYEMERPWLRYLTTRVVQFSLALVIGALAFSFYVLFTPIDETWATRFGRAGFTFPLGTVGWLRSGLETSSASSTSMKGDDATISGLVVIGFW